MTGHEHHNVSVGFVLDVDDGPITLYIWAHLVAATLVEELWAHGVAATVVCLDIDGVSGTMP